MPFARKPLPADRIRKFHKLPHNDLPLSKYPPSLSKANSVNSSSEIFSSAKRNCPFRLKLKAKAPTPAKFPPPFEKVLLTSEAERFYCQ